MSKAVENPDVDYCRQYLAALNSLEESRAARNENYREFTEESARRRAILAGILAAIIPVIVWLYLFFVAREILWGPSTTGGPGQLRVMNILAIFAVTAFLFVFLFLIFSRVLKAAANSGLGRALTAGLRHKYEQQRSTVNAKALGLLDSSPLSDTRIPERFQSVQGLSLLLRYFKSGQATMLDDAIYMLDSDLASVSRSSSLLPAETLVEKERDYFQQIQSDPDYLPA